MRIKLTFEDKNVIIKMYNNSTFRQLMAQLPATFTLTDFAGKEKITELPRGLFPKVSCLFMHLG